jgi:hypothetical protein
VSRIAEIAAFVSLADGTLSPEILVLAIGRRWPGASGAEVDEAMARAAAGLPERLDDRVAMDVAAAGVLGRRR